MEACWEQIVSYIDAHKDRMLEDLKTLVNLEGHYEEKANVEKVRDWVRTQFEAEGFHCHIREVAPDRAGLLIGILGPERPGKPVLFSGHMDTVFHAGAFGGPHPFRMDGDKLHGPGVHDMKGGIIISLYVIKALNAVGWNECPIKILFVGEEESDHIGNRADEMIMEESRGALCAFNMESGHENNGLTTGRKSQMTFYMTTTGVGGHAGVDFLIGRNAINEAVHKLEEITRLTDLEKGTTVTPSIIHGGIHGSGIPETCSAVIDVRIDSEDERNRILKSMEKIMNHNFTEGTHTKYHVDFAQFKPYVEDEKIRELHGLLSGTSVSLGFKPFGKVHSGGAADSGNIAWAGVPVLCGCGIQGGLDHSTKEYALLPSLYDRAKILACAVTRLPEFYVPFPVDSDFGSEKHITNDSHLQ